MNAMSFSTELRRWRFLFVYLITGLSCFPAYSDTPTLNIHPPDIEEMKWIGSKIYQNECASKPENLIHWGVGEEFPSLGIGHFIWYPKGYKGPFHETFPQMVLYVQQHDKTPVSILEQKPLNAPWSSKKLMLQARKTMDYQQLQNWLLGTQHFQAMFIVEQFIERLSTHLEMREDKSHKKELIKLINRLLVFKEGRFALIDYTNFKGIGNQSEEYQGQQWGLISVLKEVLLLNPNIVKSSDQLILESFIFAAKKRLKLRVENAPKHRAEQRWLKGWFKRIDDYSS